MAQELLSIINGANLPNWISDDGFSNEYETIRCSDSPKQIYHRLFCGAAFEKEFVDYGEYAHLVVREAGKEKRKRDNTFILITNTPLDGGFVSNTEGYPPGFLAVKLICRYNNDTCLYTEEEDAKWRIHLSMSAPFDPEHYDPLVYRAATFIRARSVMRGDKLSVVPLLTADIACCLYLDDDREVCEKLGMDYDLYKKLETKILDRRYGRVLDLHDAIKGEENGDAFKPKDPIKRDADTLKSLDLYDPIKREDDERALMREETIPPNNDTLLKEFTLDSPDFEWMDEINDEEERESLSFYDVVGYISDD